MDKQKSTTTKALFTAEAILANADSTSDAIDISQATGFFSLQVALTGDGTAQFEYLASNDGTTYITQSAAADLIFTGFTKTSGPGSDGKDIITFEPELCKFIKIKCTETGGANSITITSTIAVQ